MPLGSCARTLDSEELLSPIELAPWATVQEDQCRVTWVWSVSTRAVSAYNAGPWVMWIHKASLLLGHLLTSPGPTIKWRRGEVLPAEEASFQKIHSPRVSHRCLLPPPHPQKCCVMFPSPLLTSLRMSYASLGSLASDLYSGNSRRASVAVWCVLSLSLNDFPKPRIACVWYEGALSPPGGAWERHSFERLENCGPAEKSQGKWRRQVKEREGLVSLAVGCPQSAL